jgi:endogenous inhibitor of DNA gyrase (YacG/DUF329 family)
MSLIVKCPSCGTSVVWSAQQAYRPFCSERCRLIDLGEWATGSYAIPVNEPMDESEPDDQDWPPAERDS